MGLIFTSFHSRGWKERAKSTINRPITVCTLFNSHTLSLSLTAERQWRTERFRLLNGPRPRVFDWKARKWCAPDKSVVVNRRRRLFNVYSLSEVRASERVWKSERVRVHSTCPLCSRLLLWGHAPWLAGSVIYSTDGSSIHQVQVVVPVIGHFVVPSIDFPSDIEAHIAWYSIAIDCEGPVCHSLARAGLETHLITLLLLIIRHSQIRAHNQWPCMTQQERERFS